MKYPTKLINNNSNYISTNSKYGPWQNSSKNMAIIYLYSRRKKFIKNEFHMMT